MDQRVHYIVLNRDTSEWNSNRVQNQTEGKLWKALQYFLNWTSAPGTGWLWGVCTQNIPTFLHFQCSQSNIQSVGSGLEECIGKLRFLAKHLISFCFHRETNGMVGMPGAVSSQTVIALEKKISCSYSIWYTPLKSFNNLHTLWVFDINFDSLNCDPQS